MRPARCGTPQPIRASLLRPRREQLTARPLRHPSPRPRRPQLSPAAISPRPPPILNTATGPQRPRARGAGTDAAQEPGRARHASRRRHIVLGGLAFVIVAAVVLTAVIPRGGRPSQPGSDEPQTSS